jgi:predicted nucleic acid-binding protein
MVVADTCIWVEWFINSDLAPHFETALLDTEHLIVPTAVQMELYKWVAQASGAEQAMHMINYTTQGQVLPLSQDIALLAAQLAPQHGLSFADAVIYASAQHLQATLLTSDAHFKGLPNVEYISKSSKTPNSRT